MTPLDLTAAPPRPARDELAGIIFLPRSIDKARASLPGGRRGVYNIEGFTQMMFEQLGITFGAFLQTVAAARDDDEVGAFVSAATTPERIAAWNAFIAERKPRGGDRAAAIEVYPWLAEREDLPLALDVLAEDDRRLFAGT